MESTLWTRVPKNMMEWKSLLSDELLPFQSCVSLYTSTENWRWSYFVWKNIEISFKRKCVLVSNLYRQVAKCKCCKKLQWHFCNICFSVEAYCSRTTFIDIKCLLCILTWPALVGSQFNLCGLSLHKKIICSQAFIAL